MTRAKFKLSLLAAALLPSALQAYDIAVTPDYEKAEIIDRKVAVSIIHSCSNGEGYEGEAELKCDGRTETRPVGFGNEEEREAVFSDVAELFGLQPGVRTFEGNVVLTDLDGNEIRVSAETEVEFCRWNTLLVKPVCHHGKPHYRVSLDSVENYDPKTENPVFSVGVSDEPGAVLIDRTGFPDGEDIPLKITDAVWGASKSVKIPNDSGGDIPCAGQMSVSLGSVEMTLPVASFPGDIGRRILSLTVSAKQWSPDLATRASLSTRLRDLAPDAAFFTIDLNAAATPPGESPWRAVRDGGGLLQLQYPEGFTDLTNYPSGGYGITGYDLTDATATSTNDLRYLAATNQPVRFHYDVLPRESEIRTLADGSCATNPGLVVTGYLAGGATNTWEYVYAAPEDGEDGPSEWRLVTQGLVREWHSTTPLGPDRRAIRRRVAPAGGGAPVSDVLTVEQRFPWGWSRVAEITDPDGAALSNTWTYAEEGAGSYGRVVSETDENDATVTYAYDALGRVTVKTSPTPSGLRRTEYGYAPVDGRENAASPLSPSTPRTTSEYIGDTLVSRSWTAVFMEDGLETTISERAASQTSSYGDAGNLRDESAAYPVSSSRGRLAGRPVRRLSSDGALTTYSYAFGRLSDPDDTGFRVFTPSAAGTFLRVTALRASSAAPDGVPGQSTLAVSVTDALGDEVYSETRVLTAPGVSEAVSWKTSAYDADGRLVSALSSDGSREEHAYGEHGPVRSKDASGAVTETTYDALGRAVRSVVRDGTGFDKTTETAYDAAGRVVSTTVSAGNLRETTTTAYDAAGREILSSTPDGLETATAYGRIPGTPFVFTETTMRPCAALAENPDAWAATNRSVRYKCGIAAWTERNGVRRTTRAYGVGPDGSQWTETYEGPDGTNSPAWTMTVSDFTGGASGCGGSGSRVASAFKPASGGGALETRSEYDALGRLAATRVFALSEDDAETPVSATGYAYDALGNRVLEIRDADGDGRFTLDGADPATSNATRHVKLGGDWYSETAAYVFPTEGSAEAVLQSRMRTRLTGLGAATPFGVLRSETRTLAPPSAEETVARTFADRDANASATVTETPGSAFPSLAFSAGGLLVSNVTPAGVSSAYAYDALGRTVSATDGRGNTTTRVYGEYGRLLSSTDATGATTTYEYDPLGRTVAVTDPLGNVTRSEYDSEGRLAAQWGAAYPAVYAYDEAGRMTSLTTFRDEAAALAREGGDTTTWIYDAATGLLLEKIYADGRGPAYAYTPDGRLAARAWARGAETWYAYDFAGNLTNVSYSSGAPAMSFAYDRQGRQTAAVVEGVSTNLYAYSVHGQLTNEVQNGVAVARAYDALGRPAGLALDGGETFAAGYAYDNLGRLASVTCGTNVFAYSRLPGTDLVSGYASGDFSRTVAYEPLRDLVAAVTNRFCDTTVSAFAYANDAAGRRTAIGRSGVAFGALSGAADAYGYDGRSQVVSARRALGGADVRGFDYDYAYDAIGNRVSSSLYDEQGEAQTSRYVANALNQYASRTVPGNVQVHGEADAAAVVTVNENPTWRSGEYFYGGDYADNTRSATNKQVEIVAVLPAAAPGGEDEIAAVTGRVFVAKTPEVFTYDADGNMTSDGRFMYTWNDENRMVSASNAEVVVTYAYDHKGRMIRKTISRGDAEPQSISYVWDNWNIISETLITNYQSPTTNHQPLTTHNVWGLDLDGTPQGAGGVGGLLAVVREDGAYIPTYDANGNISEYLSASDGSVAAHYDYSPFGETLVASGPQAASFTHRFSTRPYCQTTGFCEYQMRKYNPNLGRWMSRDPIGEEGENNVYLFCINNINEYDFLGLDTKEISIPVNGRFEYINRGPAPGWTLSRQVYYYSKEWVSDEYIISVDYEKHCSEDGTPDITFGKIKGNLKGRLDHVGISVLIIGGGYEYDITWDSPYAPKREFHNNTKKVSITYKFSVVEKYYFGLSPGLFNISFDIGLELNFHSRVVATKEVVFTHSCSCVKQEAK